MRARLSLAVAAAAILFSAIPESAGAQTAAATALTGLVTSDQEGAMEGVVVSAKKAGSIVTVSVITDAQGRYSFPANRLEAGKYTLKIRAAGYDLAAAATADVAKLSVKTGRPIREIVRERKLLPDRQLDEILSPDAMTSPGVAGQKGRKRR